MHRARCHLWPVCWHAVLALAALAPRPALAENVCDETVPADRFVDGIPAYAQCAAASSSSIYSNNGVNTRTSSGGSGWVMTQSSIGYQCTELAHRYLVFRWDVMTIPNGNAKDWCNGTPPAGMVKNSAPMHGDIMVQDAGVCGASAQYGHVAVVDVVHANDTVTVVEQNSPGRRTRAISCGLCYLHVVANDGQVDASIPDTATPDTATPDTATPDTATPDTATPDSAEPDAGPPDTGKDHTKPDMAETPDTAETPDMAETPDAAEAPDTAELPDTAEAPDTAEEPDTAELPDGASADDAAAPADAADSDSTSHDGAGADDAGVADLLNDTFTAVDAGEPADTGEGDDGPAIADAAGPADAAAAEGGGGGDGQLADANRDASGQETAALGQGCACAARPAGQLPGSLAPLLLLGLAAWRRRRWGA